MHHSCKSQLSRQNFRGFNLKLILTFYCIRLDDIEDGSEKRRMMPAAHVRFGVPLALNAAHYAAALSLEKISKFGKLRAEVICNIFVCRKIAYSFSFN